MNTKINRNGWIAFYAVVSTLAVFVFLSKYQAKNTDDRVAKLLLESGEVLVTVAGAVEKPGAYLVEIGTSLKDVIHKAKPFKNANLKSFDLNEIISAPLELQIKELKEIFVTVVGEIQGPVHLKLPFGSRICDLKDKVIFTKDTKKEFFRKKKQLKDGDKIEVPKKTIE